MLQSKTPLQATGHQICSGVFVPIGYLPLRQLKNIHAGMADWLVACWNKSRCIPSFSVWFYLVRTVQKTRLSNQNSCNGHFLKMEYLNCTNCGRNIELFDYEYWRWYLCRLHKIDLSFTAITSPQATSRRPLKPW